jgi:hypothetical protein
VPCRAEQMPKARVFASSFDRPEISYRVVMKDLASGPLEQLAGLITSHLKQEPGASAIVYCRKRQTTEQVAAGLTKRGNATLSWWWVLAYLLCAHTGPVRVCVAWFCVGRAVVPGVPRGPERGHEAGGAGAVHGRAVPRVLRHHLLRHGNR